MALFLQTGFVYLLLAAVSFISNVSNYPSSFTAQGLQRKDDNRQSNPLINDDGRVYMCSVKSFLAFENNGTMAWTLPLGYICNVSITPVHGGLRTLYVVAENRVLKINLLNVGTSEPALEVFFGPEPGDIIGLSISTSISCILITVKKRGLFALRLNGKPLWTAGPGIYQHGYRQGCRKSTTDCYFSSVPVIDQCEASIYVSNNQGELYSLSVRTPHFKWIQDLSSIDKIFTATPGNNGRLYVTVPARALVLALDVSRGTILWQKTIGPLSKIDYAPTVDSNGWVSIGSLDGFLYSFSPTGDLRKTPKGAATNLVIQQSPVRHCSGSAVYISQTVVEGKVSHTIGDYTYISAMKPRNVVFSLLVPATGSIYWSESYPGDLQFFCVGPVSSLLSKSDLQQFVLDERILLAFLAASSAGSRLPCRSTRQKLASSCSQAMPKHSRIYSGNERAILLFLMFETIILILVAALVRFCCIFWKKKKLHDQELGNFLEKRRSLRLEKKAYDKTIADLEQRAAEDALDNEALKELGNMVRAKEGIERKLSTTYSLGSDRVGSQSKPILPLHDGKTKSFSFRGLKKDNSSTSHTLSDSSSKDCRICKRTKKSFYKGAKVKAPMEVESSSDDESYEGDHESISPDSAPGSRKIVINPLFMEQVVSEPVSAKISDEIEIVESPGSKNLRRRTLSSSN